MNEMDDREKQRLTVLARYDMMDTPREPSFDELAELAAKLCGVPIAVVNLVGDLKVLFMTGYAENATIANGFLDPGMEMMTKPFAIEMMATRIRTIIEAQRS